MRTIAQTAVATIGTSAVLSDVNWKVVVSASVLSGILSILTAFAGLPEADQQMYIDTIEEVSDDE